jgi:hypothetical protein
MRSHVGLGDDWVAMGRALRSTWLRYLPSWSCPPVFDLRGSAKVTFTGEEFRPDVVRRCRTLLAPLAVTAVDKQSSALLLQCPVLYEAKYLKTFCEEIDPGHFSCDFENEDDCLKAMKLAYNGGKWKTLGGWRERGQIPQHYILPKYKDIIAECSEVMKKKGTC